MKPPDFQLAPPIAQGPLAVFPIVAAAPDASRYHLLDDALAEGLLEITEVGDDGHVPEVSVKNKGARPVLLLEGDVLVGAKQNRTLNATLVVPARSHMTVPVSCVEAGRWARASERFTASGRKVPRRVHASLKRSVLRSARTGSGYRSNQSEVWDRVDQTLAGTATESGTRALDAAYLHRAAELADLEAKLPYPGRATGLAVSLGGQIVGAEVFDSEETCRRVWSRIVSSFSLDALLEAPEGDPPTPAAVQKWLRDARRWESAPPLGAGERYFTESDASTATLLIDEDALVHASYVAEVA